MRKFSTQKKLCGSCLVFGRIVCSLHTPPCLILKVGRRIKITFIGVLILICYGRISPDNIIGRYGPINMLVVISYKCRCAFGCYANNMGQSIFWSMEANTNVLACTAYESSLSLSSYVCARACTSYASSILSLSSYGSIWPTPVCIRFFEGNNKNKMCARLYFLWVIFIVIIVITFSSSLPVCSLQRRKRP